MPAPLLPLLAAVLLVWLSEPARALVVVGQAQVDPALRALEIEPEGRFLFVAGGTGGLRVLDAADVRAPVQVGAWEDGEAVYHVAVSGGLAAVSLADAVVLIDVTDRHAPSEISRVLLDGAGDVALDDSRLYVAWETGAGPEQIQTGLQVFDVSDPASPAPIGDWGAQEFLGGLALQDGLVAFSSFQIEASAYQGRLRILDVRDEGPPAPIGRFDAPGLFARPGWSGSRVLVPMRNGGFEGPSGLRVLDIPSDGDPVERGVWTTHLDVARMRARGDLAVAALAFGGVVLVDVSDPDHPSPRGEIAPPGRWMDFTDAVFDGAYLHVGGESSVVTVSLADPDHPKRLAGAALPGEPRSGLQLPHTVTVEGARAYVTNDTRRLYVVDLADPAAPRLADEVTLPGRAVTDTVALGAHVFATWRSYTAVGQPVGGLVVFDATDPDALVPVGELDGLGPAHRVLRHGTLLVVGSSFQVHLVDAATPGAPVLRTSILLPEALQTLARVGTRVYAGWQDFFHPYLFGTSVIGIEDPDAPSLAPELPFVVHGVAERDGLVLVGDLAQLGVFASDLAGDPLATLPVSAQHVRDDGRLVWLSGRAGLQAVDLPAPDRVRALGGVATKTGVDRLGELWVATDFAELAVFDLGAEYTASDRDGDGRLDAVDACPDLAGADDRDTDRDGTGDACDPTPVPEPVLGRGGALAFAVLAGLRRRRDRC